MFTRDELEKLRNGGKKAFKELFDSYARHIFREAVDAYNGDRKLAAKKVWDTFYRLNELVKTGQEDRALFGVLTQAEKVKKVEDACIDTVWRSIESLPDDKNRQDSTASVTRASERAQANSGAKNDAANNPSRSKVYDQNLQDDLFDRTREMVPEYPSDVLEGSEMENKRESFSVKQRIILIVIVLLSLFLIWSMAGILLGLLETTQHIDIGFWKFINAIRGIFGW